jgi:hypothetical protein
MASPRRQLPLGTQLWVRCFGQEWAPARVVDEAEYDLSSLHDQFPPNATTAVEFFDDGNFFLVDASDATTVQPLEFSSARAREPKYREALDLARAMKASEEDAAPQQQPGGTRAAPTHEDGGGPSPPPSAATAAVVPPRPLAAPAAAVMGRVPSGTSFDARDRNLMRQYLAHLGSDNEDVQLALSMLQRDGVDVARLMAEGGGATRAAAATTAATTNRHASGGGGASRARQRDDATLAAADPLAAQARRPQPAAEVAAAPTRTPFQPSNRSGGLGAASPAAVALAPLPTGFAVPLSTSRPSPVAQQPKRHRPPPPAAPRDEEQYGPDDGDGDDWPDSTEQAILRAFEERDEDEEEEEETEAEAAAGEEEGADREDEEEQWEEGGEGNPFDQSVTDEDVARARELVAWRPATVAKRLGIAPLPQSSANGDTASAGAAAAAAAVSRRPSASMQAQPALNRRESSSSGSAGGHTAADAAAVATALALDPSWQPLCIAGVVDVNGLGGTCTLPLHPDKSTVRCPAALQDFSSPTSAGGGESFFNNEGAVRQRRHVRVLIVPLLPSTANAEARRDAKVRDNASAPVGWMDGLEMEDPSSKDKEPLVLRWCVRVGNIPFHAPPNWRIPLKHADTWNTARASRVLDITDAVPFGATELKLVTYAENARRAGLANEGLWDGALAVVVARQLPLETLIAHVAKRKSVVITPPPTTEAPTAMGAALADADEDEVVAAGGTARVSCTCPLTMKPMTVPSRGARCVHPQCVELQPWLSEAIRSGLWVCAWCREPLPFAEVVVDAPLQGFIATRPLAKEAVLDLSTGLYRST